MKSLRECKTLSEAEPFLRGAKPTFRKTVETAYALLAHPNPTQQAIGQTFLQTAIQEVEDKEEPVPKHGDGVKPKDDHFVKEEELQGGNQSGTSGSEQSTDNTPPYPQEGEKSEDGQKDMEKAEGTENQFSEMMPGMMPGMGQPGIDPKLAQQMAPAQGLPPMNTPQQIQQMQYTVREMTKGMVKKMSEMEKIIGWQNKAIKDLSGQFKETMTLRNGIDVNGLAERKVIPSVQETMPDTVSNIDPTMIPPRIYEKKYSLQDKRSKIAEMNRMLENQ
jgi:hypothetical protein